MALPPWLLRQYYIFRYTSTFTGSFIFWLLRTGFVKFIVLFILVRLYRIRLETYVAVSRDLPIVAISGLGRYLYSGRHSNLEVAEAVFAARSPEEQQAWLQLQEGFFTSTDDEENKQVQTKD
jgi:hypothetical protein